jgi:propionyl-CoA synthetase
MGGNYQATYARSLSDPDGFWAEAAEALEWERRWDRVLDDSRPPFYRWFSGGRLNTCHNAVDRHVAARGDQPALIYDSPVTGSVRTVTFAELKDQVARCAGALRKQGVGPGDRVILYMPMVPETVVAMLACARLGAIHSVVFGGFAAHELATRIDDARPKLIVSASCGIEVGRVIPYKPLLDEAIAQAKHKPERCIILMREQCAADLQKGRDVVWQDVVPVAAPAGCVAVAATHPR